LYPNHRGTLSYNLVPHTLFPHFEYGSISGDGILEVNRTESTKSTCTVERAWKHSLQQNNNTAWVQYSNSLFVLTCVHI